MALGRALARHPIDGGNLAIEPLRGRAAAAMVWVGGGVGSTLWSGAAAFIAGRLIVSGIDMGQQRLWRPPNPYMIAAFAVPAESLAASGWAQTEGNAGLGMRKQTP